METSEGSQSEHKDGAGEGLDSVCAGRGFQVWEFDLFQYMASMTVWKSVILEIH
jgi:hypothetical protein